MTKKHFERFAIALALIPDDETRATVRAVIEEVARDGNRRFDMHRFRSAVETLRLGERPNGFSLELFASWAGILNRNCERIAAAIAAAGSEVRP